MNPFTDGPNPYEPPGIIQAQLATPKRRKWTPYFSFAFVVFGPLIWLVLIRYSLNTWKLFALNSPVEIAIDLTAAFVWIIAAVRSLWWLLAHSWR